MDESLVTIPAPPVRARRAHFPWLAALVPLIGGVVLWVVTASPYAMLFGALGPIIAVASMLDAARTGRRAYREARAAHGRQLERARARIAEHHASERARWASRHPDALALIALPARIWRALPGDAASLVLARGSRRSACRVSVAGGDDDGGDGDDDRGIDAAETASRARGGRGDRGAGRGRRRGRPDDGSGAVAVAALTPAQLRAEARTVRDAPITIPAAEGVMVLGDAPFARAAARALVLQLCMTHAPDALRLAALPPDGWDWARELPHAEPSVAGPAAAVAWGSMSTSGRGESPLRLEVVDASADDRASERGGAFGAHALDVRDGEIRIACGPAEAPVDPRCGALVEVRGADGAAALSLTGPSADQLAAPGAAWGAAGVGVGHGHATVVQLLGETQARTIVALLRDRALALFPPVDQSSPPALGELLAEASSRAGIGAHPPGCPLPAPFAVADGAPLPIDIVTAGPHALIAGTTGSGKSELMVSWITALCALYPPERVVLLLADFKGGTAFAALAELPHVVGMITDLDASGASRALESLRAELRWREARLADADARDIADGRVDMPRLIVVIDEFAALLAQHPELDELFADVAARGRALGVHLMLGTQRAAGTVRDGLLANIPLRFCLRVVDEGESRAVL
ncbi:MAG: hypothetical protein GX871_01375, partial [Microbacteriaceae bacterium]|nr:hypothetical protein [Microbacteriaceae bacterium]